MTIFSEIGDSTFFAAAILAMHHPRRLVLAGCLASLVVMTVLSVLIGWAAPNLIPRTWTHHIATSLYFGFGLWSLWEGFTEEGESEELAEVEAKLDADQKPNTATKKSDSKEDDDLKKQKRPFLTHFFSPIFLKAFSITFFGEWGDRSQIATIGLASDENPIGVVLGGIIGQALCIIAAVIGGKSLASQISEKMVALMILDQLLDPPYSLAQTSSLGQPRSKIRFHDQAESLNTVRFPHRHMIFDGCNSFAMTLAFLESKTTLHCGNVGATCLTTTQASTPEQNISKSKLILFENGLKRVDFK